MNIAIELDHKTSSISWAVRHDVTIFRLNYSQTLRWNDNKQICNRLKALLDSLPDHITTRRAVITIANSVKPIDQKRLFGFDDILGISVIRVVLSTTAAAFYLMANCTDEETSWLIYSLSCDGMNWGFYEQCLVDGEYQLEVWMTGYDKSLFQMKQYFNKHYGMKYIYKTVEINDPNASILGAFMYAAMLDGLINNRIILDTIHWNHGVLVDEIRKTYICENCFRMMSPIANLPVCHYCHHSLTSLKVPMISAKPTSKRIFHSLIDPFSTIPTIHKRTIWLDKNVTRIPLAVTDNCGQVFFTRYIPKPIQRGALTGGLLDCQLDIDASHTESIYFSSPRSHQYPFFIYPKCNSIGTNNSDLIIDESIQTIELPTIQFSQRSAPLPLLSDEEIEKLLHPLEIERDALGNIDEDTLDDQANSIKERELCNKYSTWLTQDEIEALLYFGTE